MFVIVDDDPCTGPFLALEKMLLCSVDAGVCPKCEKAGKLAEPPPIEVEEEAGTVRGTDVAGTAG
jgi:hypothetical protein